MYLLILAGIEVEPCKYKKRHDAIYGREDAGYFIGLWEAW